MNCSSRDAVRELKPANPPPSPMQLLPLFVAHSLEWHTDVWWKWHETMAASDGAKKRREGCAGATSQPSTPYARTVRCAH